MPEDQTPSVKAFPALVQVRAIDDALLERIRERVPDPAVLEEFAPYTWTALISNNTLDAYFTKMRPSSLRNYAADAQAGVAFQDSHKTDGMVRTLGHSLDARYVGPGGDGVAHTDADFFTLIGVDPIIDTFVRRVRGGLARDVSIGFHGGEYICSICGRDMMRDWDCWHIPGFEYVVVDKETGKKTDTKIVATADIENARLSEVSTVYDGATPGAAIIKAQREADAGRLKPEQARLLEARYRIHLPGTSHVHPAVSMKESTMKDPATDERTTPETDPGQRALTTLASLRSLFGAETTDDGLITRVSDLLTEHARLAPLARDGEAYRTQRIERAITEGKRAYGETFDETARRALLEKLPIDEIDERGDLWEERARLTFPGGRQSQDEQAPPPDTAPAQRTIPDAAYSTRGA